MRDALVSVFADTIEGLPHGATFGAASLRRQAQALRLRPDLRPTLMRGNVETRLKKAEAGAVGATLLALAGLKRLGLSHRARAVLDLDRFLPAPGQGAIAITARSADARALQALEPISDAATAAALAAERAFLAELEGSCRTPIAGLARLEAGRLLFRGEVLRPTAPSASTSPRKARQPTPSGLGGKQGATSRRACRKGCWPGMARAVAPNPSKQNQATRNKKAWICLVLIIQIGTFQCVTANQYEKI